MAVVFGVLSCRGSRLRGVSYVQMPSDKNTVLHILLNDSVTNYLRACELTEFLVQFRKEGLLPRSCLLYICIYSFVR